MSRQRRGLSWALALLAPAALLGSGRAARADLEVELISGAQTTFYTTTSGELTQSGISFAGYSINYLDVNSNSQTPGATSADLTIADVQIYNLSGTAPLHILVTDDRFTVPPTGPRTITNSGSVTFAQGGESFAITSYAGTGLFDKSGFATPTVSFTSTSSALSGSGTKSAVWGSSANPYSLTSETVVNLIKGYWGADISNAGETMSVATAPEPAALALAATALPLLALAARRRARRERA